MAQVLVGTEFTPPLTQPRPSKELGYQTVISKRSEIVLQASVTARISHICTSTIFSCSIQDKIQTLVKNICERTIYIDRQQPDLICIYI